MMRAATVASLVLLTAGCSLLQSSPQMTCESGETCRVHCVDGEVVAPAESSVVGERCTMLCEPGAHCELTCGLGGSCTQVCDDADCAVQCVDSDCRQQCTGGECDLLCTGSDCHQLCTGGADCTQNDEAPLLPADASCHASWQCDSGFCHQDHCRIGCQGDDDCPGDRWCSFVDEVCYPACVESDCPDGQTCVVEERGDGQIEVCK